MAEILIGNAPCSWGTLEFDDLGGESIGYEQMLDELAATGYGGSELGDWGFMPTDPRQLAREFSDRDLALLGAFVPVGLANSSSHELGLQTAVRTAQLLAAVHELTGARYPPYLVLADENGVDPQRTSHAGRVTEKLSLDRDQWSTFARGADQIARSVLDETGLRTVFHHHCAGFVETPEEIARLLDSTNPDLVGLVFDTGHLIYGSGANDPDIVAANLERFAPRIWYVHFKDCQPQVAARCRAEAVDYFDAVGAGVFCELGQGCVDFPAVVEWLRNRNYCGWALVEQDVLPGMGAPRESASRNRQYLKSIGV